MEVDKTNCLCELLQLVGTAAILVDHDGNVVGLNDAARDCLGSGLQIRNRRLTMADSAAQRALLQLIEADRHARGTHAAASEQIVVARRNARPLILRAIRLDGCTASLFHPAHAIVVVLDAGRVNLPTEAQLASAFGLSRGEARLAICLASGEMLESAARHCGISYETARKRIKVMFEKTDTRRQSELVALVVRVGTLMGAACAVAGQSMPPAPRLRLVDGPLPAFRQRPDGIPATSSSDRLKQLSTA